MAQRVTPSFTRAEYWLLEAAVEQSVIIAETGNGDAAVRLNRRDHGASHEELVDALERLSADGLIVGRDYQGEGVKPGQLTRRRIESELSRKLERRYYDDGMFIDGFGPEALHYKLTKSGGAAWEAFARPQWDAYIADFRGCNNEQMTGEATCVQKRRLEAYVRGLHWLGWEIDIGSVAWEDVEPWQATYWKQLPRACRVRFHIVRFAEHVDWHAIESFLSLPRWYRWQS